MLTYKICLFGHRDLSNYKIVEEGLGKIIKDLIRKNVYPEILIGRDGEFDIFSASVIKSIKRALGNETCELNLILPYKRRDIEFYEKYYDNVTIPSRIEKKHPKCAIKERNKVMIEESDLVICYVEKSTGGAYNALKYANELGKKTLNLAKDVVFTDF